MTSEGIYKSTYAEGSRVRVADRDFLERFMTEWNYHHKLQLEQLAYANAAAVVEKVGFYHGGDVLYNLKDVPGIWHEQCLRPA
jgi:diadenosine tetraphosphatase ApaH/serine/threonine PP2A family protein phosphatase